MKLYVDPDWTFEEAVKNIKALRYEYESILSSFFYFDLHEEVQFKKRLKKDFYSLNISEHQKNLLWNYMNGNEYYYVLKQNAERNKRK